MTAKSSWIRLPGTTYPFFVPDFTSLSESTDDVDSVARKFPEWYSSEWLHELFERISDSESGSGFAGEYFRQFKELKDSVRRDSEDGMDDEGSEGEVEGGGGEDVEMGGDSDGGGGEDKNVVRCVRALLERARIDLDW